MDLSVVVCTYNRYDALADCLRALRAEAQTAAASAYQVIVVDNTPEPLRRVTIDSSEIAYWIVCNEVGLSNARNAGIAAAQSDIVAFVDDDAIVSPGWCEEAISVFQRHPDALAAGGKVVPEFPDGLGPPWVTKKLTEYLSCIDWGDDEHALREGEWIVGANMAFRRTVFDDGTLFATGLGRKGNLGLLSNEEIALIRAIGRERIVYVPSMLVQHVISSERLTQAWFRKRVFWQAISDELAGIDIPSTARAREDLRGIIPRLPAERRSLAGLWAHCPDPGEFALQLRELQLVAHLLASGVSEE
jgi:glycosyltransferase involved in cell wall biosynthesis